MQPDRAGPDEPYGDSPAQGEGGAGEAEARGGGRKAFLLRLSPELLAELRAWASGELRSLNAHIEYLLRDAVRRRRNSGDE